MRKIVIIVNLAPQKDNVSGFGWDQVLSSKTMTVSELTVWQFPQIATAVLLPTLSSLTSSVRRYAYFCGVFPFL